MNEKIKEAYEKVHISEEAKQRILTKIMTKERNVNIGKRRKLAAAACLAAVFLVPAGGYAAQKIYQRMTTSVTTTNYRVDMQVDKTESTAGQPDTAQKYIRVTADFGSAYRLEKDKPYTSSSNDEDDAMISYTHKGGFSSGKCFWYETLYMDGDQNEILSVYDVEGCEQIVVNGRKAVYCQYYNVAGSQHEKDHKTDYTQSIYIFVEDYGYIIQMAAQKGLSREKFIKLAEKLQITEAATKDEAQKYVPYSKRQKPAWEIQTVERKERKIDQKFYHTGAAVKVGETTVKLEKVQILDSVKTLKQSAFGTNVFAKKKLTDPHGNLLKYERETLAYGNSVSEPNRSVKKTQKIQPKLVYVTIELENPESAAGDGNYQVPSLQPVSKEDGKIYAAEDIYNRPAYVQEAFAEHHMPCYFEESLSGTGAWQAKITGKTMKLHFAYLVDEDQVQGMALLLNDWISQKEEPVYLDISQEP